MIAQVAPACNGARYAPAATFSIRSRSWDARRRKGIGTGPCPQIASASRQGPRGSVPLPPRISRIKVHTLPPWLTVSFSEKHHESPGRSYVAGRRMVRSRAMDPRTSNVSTIDGHEGHGVSYREMPNNIEAEEALLGAILVNNDAALRVNTFLTPEHFYDPVQRPNIRHRPQGDRAWPNRHAGHSEDLFRGRRGAGRHRRQRIPRPPSRRGRHDHQRRGLRPADPRSRDPPPAHRKSAKTWSPRRTSRSPITRRASRSKRPRNTCSTSPSEGTTRAASDPSHLS